MSKDSELDECALHSEVEEKEEILELNVLQEYLNIEEPHHIPELCSKNVVYILGCVIICKNSFLKNGECYFYGLGHFKIGKPRKKIKKLIFATSKSP